MPLGVQYRTNLGPSSSDIFFLLNHHLKKFAATEHPQNTCVMSVLESHAPKLEFQFNSQIFLPKNQFILPVVKRLCTHKAKSRRSNAITDVKAVIILDVKWFHCNNYALEHPKFCIDIFSNNYHNKINYLFGVTFKMPLVRMILTYFRNRRKAF